MSKTLVLVDGSSYLFRAFHAMPALTNSKGDATGAVYGVTNMLRRLLADYDPEHVAVVFDAKGKTFRNDMYKDYKANRPPMPAELAGQIEAVHEVVRAMGLPLLCVPGVEADDVIGTLARQASAQGIDTVISTGDKDLAQLVDAHVTLVNTMNDTRMDRDGVIKKFDIPPEQVTDYLALIGDTVDNVPGVPKVGPKTALKWLEQYGSLDAVIEHADEIKGKVGENLRATLDQLPLSRELVTIKCDVELEHTPEQLARGTPNHAALRELYAQLEFRTWLAEVIDAGEDGSGDARARGASEGATLEPKYDTVLTQAAFAAWLARLQDAPLFAFDLETTSLDYMQAEIVGVSFAVASGAAAYVPVAHDYPGAPAQLSREVVLAQLRPLLEDAERAKLGQNLKYDMSVLANYDIELRGIRFDTMLESYVLDSTASRHDMDSLALKYLAHRTIHYEDVAGKGAKQIGFNEVTIEEAAPYAAEDAEVTFRLHDTLWPRLQEQESLARVFHEIEIPLVPVLSRMERRGVRIDSDMLARQSGELAARMAEIEQQAHSVAGEPFNLASPKQIQAILFDKLGLPVLSKTPKGAPSTAESVLQELALDYELPRLILEHRGLSKLKSTYADKLPQQVNPASGRVHTSYQQAVAATGRLSSTDPNLQNIPVRTEEGRQIRKAFIPADDEHTLLVADYSQIELRILAHYSGDKGLIKAFKEREDIHARTAAEVYGVNIKKVTPEMRRAAKTANFAVIYGVSAFGLSQQSELTVEESKEFIETYFDRYPGIKKYMDDMKQTARDKGYVTTLFNRRRYLPEIHAKNFNVRQFAERIAINTPIQGTAADMIKVAMIKIHDKM
ncbi:MAG: DNA polymerase I, partial [Pseudomonadota bacterium]